MNDHVTFETAILLKEAGFPQPEKSTGQFWWVDEKSMGGAHYRHVLYVILQAWQGWLSGVAFPVNTNCGERWLDEMQVFAPTATDILNELPGYAIRYNFENETWMVFKDEMPNPYFHAHIDPAEAAAMAWLAINEKK
jgi:hypothetical protein